MARRSACDAGANDLGGVLMNESITRAAGAMHGQEICAEDMEQLIAAGGSDARQRTTLYGPARPARTSSRSPNRQRSKRLS